MAQQQFYQPGRQRRDDEEPTSPNIPTTPNVRSSNLSENSNRTLGNIDDALAANEAIRPKNATGEPLGLNNAESAGAKGPGSPSTPKNSLHTPGALEAAGFFNPEAKEAMKVAQRLKGLVTGKNKKKAAAGGLAGGVVIALIFALLLSLPNEVVSIMNSLENRDFGIATKNINDMADRMMSDYIKNRVFSRTSCSPTKNPIKFYKCIKSIRTKDETNKTVEDDPIEGKNGLYDSWDNADLASQFADKGVTFTQEGGKYLINSDSLPGGSMDVTEAIKNNEDIFKYMDKVSPGAGETLRTIYQSLVVPTGTWLHIIVTRLMATIWGDKSCVMDCSPGEEEQEHNEPTQDKVQFLDAEEQDRTRRIFGTKIAEAIKCLMDINCDPTKRQAQTGDAATDPEAGEPKSTYDTESEQAVQEAATKFGSEKLAKLLEGYANLKSAAGDAMAKLVAESLSGAFGADISKDAVKALSDKVFKIFGVAQWVQFFAEIIVFFNQVGTKLAALNYDIKGATFAQEFSMYASAGAEQQSGSNHPDSTELGSMGQGLNAPDKNGNPSDAMQSPYLQQQVDPNNTTYSNNQVHNYLEAAHYALDYANTLTQISDALHNNPAFQALADVAGVIVKVMNTLMAPVGWIMTSLLHLFHVDGLIASAMRPLLSFIVTKAFPMPNLINMSGESRGTMIAVGGKLTGAKAAEMLGGMKLTPTQASGLLADEQNSERQQFERQPLFARMFATDTPYSFVSRLSLKIPLSFGVALQTSFASLIQNPFGKLFGSFASILHPDNVFAAPPAAPDPAGITEYGFVDTPDPITYWDTHNCAQQEKQDYPAWNNAVTLNTATGQVEHTTENQCLRIQRVAQSVGALSGFQD